MGVNTDKGFRKGTVVGRTQFKNEATGHYIKRDTETGRFLAVKKDGTPFKGIRKEAKVLTYKPNPSIKLSTLKKAERAVIALHNMKRGF